MWIPFQHNSVCYIAEIDIKESVISTFISNFKRIWIKEVTIKEFEDNFKEQNPLIIPDTNKIVVKLEEELKENKCDIKVADNGLTVAFNSKLEEGYELSYKTLLNEGPVDLFFSKVSTSLLHVIQLFQLQRDILCKALEAKDKEIKQHVFEKGDIKRDDLKTEKFEPTKIAEFNQTGTLMDIFKESNNFTDTLFTTVGITNEIKMKELSGSASDNGKPKRSLKKCKSNIYVKRTKL